jgi:hypothetical protein
MCRRLIVPFHFVLEKVMRKPSAAIVLSVLLALSWIGIFVNSTSVAQEDRPAKSGWAYAHAREDELTKMGKDGWEAYAVTQRTGVSEQTFWLKKPL